MRTALSALILFAAGGSVFATAAAQRPALTALLAQPRISIAALEPIYNDAILRDGTVDQVVAQLAALGADEPQSRTVRTHAFLVASHLQWRFGKIALAMELIDRAVAIESTAPLTMQKARLLEATGKLPEARQWYEKTQALATDPEDREEATIRLAFLVTSAQNVDALVRLAKTRDRDFRNRAAVALAIMNHPAEAADLFEVFGEGTQRHRQHLRLAQWAVQARQTQKGQDEAWAAALAATLPRDIRYSLSVLVEAHELDQSWDKLLARFASQPQLGPDANAVRVDILHRLKRYDEAIALIEGDREHGMSPEGQRRLLRMYGEAGRHEKLEAEFRQLIAREPGQLAWVRGLSEYFLEQGRRDDAAQLWREFTRRNDAMEVLLEGGRTMAQQGLDELALAAADRCATLHPERSAEVIWYRYEHYLKRGQIAKAEETLRRLEQDLPADSPRRAEVAEAYERVKNPRRALAIWEDLAARPGGVGHEEMIHLAWLYDTVGQRDKALAVWKKLWASEVSDTRRKLVEDRLLLLAAEAGGIGEIAIPIEEKIARGTASPKESALLVRIYTDANDPASAIEVIQESSRHREKTPAMEIASLQEQARVYQALNRFAPYITVTEKLLKLDPENGSEYLQSLILTHIERGGKQDVEILQSRLTELRRYSAAAGDEFEAGVLVMAGFKDRGIDSYRRALARNPGSSDNYLILADLLKQDRRVDQGTAILQYFAEIAPGDDGFMVAIDGILNLRPTPDSAVLTWAHRRVLERITRHADKFYLYDLSSELAQESRDMKTYLSSLENSLVDAGPRRSTVLRELIAATEERTPGTVGGLPDPRRNLSYSRRLIAMGEEMPPEVYLNLGRAFLKMDNPGEALNAFNLAIDRTDRPSLIEESADRFEAAGYSAEATVLYEKALTADTTNIPVMAKLASSRSRDGAVGLANGLYLRAMLQLLDQQPLEVEPPAAGQPRRVSGPDSEFTFLYRRFYAYMQSGLLFTLSGENGGEATQFALIEAALDRTLQEILQRAGGATTKPLSTYPRLSVVAKLARMTGLHSGQYEFADQIDLKLLQHFGSDARTVTEIVTQRLGWGLRASAEKLRAAPGVSAALRSSLAARTTSTASLQPLTDLKAAAQQALTQKNFELAADAALAAGDNALAFSAYQAWLSSARTGGRGGGAASEGRGAVSVISSGQAPVMVSTVAGAVMLGGSTSASAGANLTRLATAARRKLEPERFRELCRQIAALAESNPDAAREMLTLASFAASSLNPNSPPERSVLFEIEGAAGRKLFTEEKLRTAVAGIDARQLMMLDMDYVMNVLPVADRGPLYLRQVQAFPASATAFPSREIMALGVLLAKPVDPESQKQILALLKDRIQKASKASPFALRSISSYLSGVATALARGFDSSNAGLLNDLDRHLAENYRESFPAPVFGALTRGKIGDEAAALQAIVDTVIRDVAQLPPDYPATNLGFFVRRSLAPHLDRIYPSRKAEFLSLVEQRTRDGGFTPALFALMLGIHQSDPAGDPWEAVAWLESVRTRAPNQRAVLESLYPLYRQLGEFEKERETLQALVTAAPEVEGYRRTLATLWRNLDHPTNALNALGGQVKPGMFPEESQTAMVQMFYIGTRTAQFNKLIAELTKPELGPEARSAFRSLLQMLPAAGVQIYQYYQSGFPAIEAGSLFAITAGPRASRAATAASVTAPLRAIETEDTEAGEAGRPAKLVERIAAQPFALPDLEAVVRTLDPTFSDGEQYLFYPLLADAYVAHGRASAEYARLTEALRAERASKKDLFVWLELAVRQPRETAADALALAEKVLATAGPVPDYQRIQLARLYARAGRSEQAVGAYQVIAISIMAGQNQRSNRGDASPLFSAVGLFSDAEKYLDRGGLAALLPPLVQATKAHGAPALELWHQRYRLWLAERALKAGVAPDQVRPLVAGIDLAKARREDLVRYALAQSRLAPAADALPTLKTALRRGAENQQASVALDINMSRYLTGLGLRTGSVVSMSATEPPALPLFKGVFPMRVEAWSGAREWVEAAGKAIPAWIGTAGVDGDLALQVLAIVALRQSQLGLPDAAGTARELSRALGQLDRVSTPTATLAVAVAEKMSVPVESAVIRKLIAGGRLDVRQLAGLVQRASEVEGPAAALALGESALSYTQNDDLLRELEALARKSGDEGLLRRLNGIRAQAGEARAKFEAPSRTTPGQRISMSLRR